MPDETGIVLSGIDAARITAIKVLTEMAAVRLPNADDSHVLKVVVISPEEASLFDMSITFQVGKSFASQPTIRKVLAAHLGPPEPLE